MNARHFISRRRVMTDGALALAGGALLGSRAFGQTALVSTTVPHDDGHVHAPGQPDVDYTPVVTPNGISAPYKVVDGVKVFHLVAHEFEHEFAPGLRAYCWGYDGRTPGPTIEVVEGDRIRVYVTNRLPEPTTVHWHGIHVANGMDGVTGLNQTPIEPGETYAYEFTLRQHGTFMYHSHFDEMVSPSYFMSRVRASWRPWPARRPPLSKAARPSARRRWRRSRCRGRR
jgi:FtsP/CotA-like multicopper oxidase with cupredoxin domain